MGIVMIRFPRRGGPFPLACRLTAQRSTPPQYFSAAHFVHFVGQRTNGSPRMHGYAIPAARIPAPVFSSKSRRRSYREPRFNLPPSCAPVLRWRQGQALRVLCNLDTAGRGRMIENAGSEGMPLSPHQGNGNAEASNLILRFTKCVWFLNCSLWETGTARF